MPPPISELILRGLEGPAWVRPALCGTGLKEYVYRLYEKNKIDREDESTEYSLYSVLLMCIYIRQMLGLL